MNMRNLKKGTVTYSILLPPQLFCGSVVFLR